MPIPLSDLKKEVRAPQVARGRVDDYSQAIANSYRPAIDLMEKINKTGDIFLKAKIAQDKSDQQLKAQDALTKYFDQRNQGFNTLSTLTGNEALEYRDKFYQDAEKAHAEALSVIDSLSDTEIRENARAQMNQYNMSGSSKANNYFFRQDELVKDQATAGLNEALTQNFKTDLTGNGELDAKSFGVVSAQIANNMITRGIAKGEDPTYTQAQIGIAKVALAQNTARELAVRGVDSGAFNAYAPALDFLYNLKGQIPEKDYINLVKSMEQEQLAYEVAARPEFFMKDGEIIKPRVDKFCPSLTPREKQIALSNLESTLKSSATKVNPGDMPAIQALERELAREFEQWRAQHGYMTRADLNKIAPWLTDEQKEEMLAGQEELRKKVKPSQALDLLRFLQDQFTTPVAVSRDLQEKVAVKTVEEQNKYADAGYIIVPSYVNDKNKEAYEELAFDIVKDVFKNGASPAKGEVWSIKDVMAYSTIQQMLDKTQRERWYRPGSKNIPMDWVSVINGTRKSYELLAERFPGYNLDLAYDNLPRTSDGQTMNQEDVWQAIAAGQQAGYKQGTRDLLTEGLRQTPFQQMPGEQDAANRARALYEARKRGLTGETFLGPLSIDRVVTTGGNVFGLPFPSTSGLNAPRPSLVGMMVNPVRKAKGENE